MDAILALKLLAELQRNFNRELHVAYIDIKSAFDSVDRIPLWKALRGFGIAIISSSLIHDLHTGTTARVCTPQGRVCQMCFTQHQESIKVVYSLLRFSAVQLIGSCDTVLVVLEMTLAISISPTSTMLMTQSFLLMIQRNGTVFRNFEASAGVMGLHTNWHKTKIQNIGTGDAPRTVHIDNQAEETVSKFTYLGSDIDSEGYFYPDA